MTNHLSPEWFAGVARISFREGARQGVHPAATALGILRSAADLGPDYLAATFAVLWVDYRATADRRQQPQLPRRRASRTPLAVPPPPRRPADDA